MPRHSREKSGKGICHVMLHNHWRSALPLATEGTQEPLDQADGQKLRVTWQTAVANIVVPLNTTTNLTNSQISSTTRTDYIGNVIYTGTASSYSTGVSLSKYLFEGGYATVTPSTHLFRLSLILI